jgi:hypothetical protein
MNTDDDDYRKAPPFNAGPVNPAPPDRGLSPEEVIAKRLRENLLNVSSDVLQKHLHGEVFPNPGLMVIASSKIEDHLTKALKDIIGICTQSLTSQERAWTAVGEIQRRAHIALWELQKARDVAVATLTRQSGADEFRRQYQNEPTLSPGERAELVRLDEEAKLLFPDNPELRRDHRQDGRRQWMKQKAR